VLGCRRPTFHSVSGSPSTYFTKDAQANRVRGYLCNRAIPAKFAFLAQIRVVARMVDVPVAKPVLDTPGVDPVLG
jgi:hypothetical protein